MIIPWLVLDFADLKEHPAEWFDTNNPLDDSLDGMRKRVKLATGYKWDNNHNKIKGQL